MAIAHLDSFPSLDATDERGIAGILFMDARVEYSAAL